MNSYLRYLTLCILLTSHVFIVTGQFQPAEVLKSNQKVIIQGKYYYIHTVHRGQTFYSICKAYGVSQEAVLGENPGIDPEALSEGQAIRIPDYTHITVPDSPRESKQKDKRFHYHTVKPGQTVYFLSRLYEVPEDWICQFNPGTRESLSVGQVIIIPKRKEFEALLSPADTSEYWYYTVKEKDTLYNLYRLYGVGIDRIINENPALQQGLKAGTVIRIPKAYADTLYRDVDSTTFLAAESVCENWIRDRKDFKIVLMLPFFSNLKIEEPLEAQEAISGEIPENPVVRQQELIGRSFIEFYEGFLLSLDTLKSKGFSIELFVYDTERDTIKVKSIIQQLYMVQPDLIIGPVYSDDVSLVGEFARNQGINLISPLSTRSELISDNPSVIQVVPSEETEYKFFARTISQYKDTPIILLRGTDSLSLRSSWILKNELLSYLDKDSLGNPLNFEEYRLNDSTTRNLGKILKRDVENIIIIASENEPDVTAMIGKLRVLWAREFKMTIYGVSVWQVWKNIDIDYFHTMQLQYCTPFYIDYDDPDVIHFIKKCRKVYGFEPYEVTPKGYNFCMLGYDIGLYFISALEYYGNSFAPCMNNLDVKPLLTQYNFIRTGEGYSNQTIHMIRYKSDYTIEKVLLDQLQETASE